NLRIESLGNIRYQVPISLALKEQVSPMLRIRSFEQPVIAFRVNCLHCFQILIEFHLCSRSGRFPKKLYQMWLLKHFVHIVLEMAETICMRGIGKHCADSFNEPLLSIRKKVFSLRDSKIRKFELYVKGSEDTKANSHHFR